MSIKPIVLILVNKPHKPQMIKLKEWLDVNLDKYEYKIVSQMGFPKKVLKIKPHAIITYNKNGYKDKTLNSLIKFCESGGKFLALHHNISSMYMNPKWLDWVGIRITKGQTADYPWSVIEGGDLFLINLKPDNIITTNGVEYNAKAPKFKFETKNDKIILTHELAEDEKNNISLLGTVPAIEIKKSEYFINHMPTPNPEREILMGQYFNDHASGRQFYSANAVWTVPKGKGRLFYSMAGHAKSCYIDPYCNIIKNILEYEKKT